MSARTPNRRSFHAQAAIVLSLVLFGGWREGTELAQLAAEVVGDPARAEAAREIGRSIDREFQAARAELRLRRAELLAELRSYDSAPRTDPARDAEYDTRIWKRQERLLQLRYELRAQMTPAEWSALYGKLRKARDGS